MNEHKTKTKGILDLEIILFLMYFVTEHQYPYIYNSAISIQLPN